MISTNTFLVKVEEIASEEPSYREGGSGADGTCDCIGLIIGAVRRAGGTWKGIHGSNYAARHEVVELLPITGTTSLLAGEVVFKAYEPGDAKWKLPSRYRSDPDQRDYCHIGVVISTNPLRIRHMTSPKPKIDTKIGKWKYHGWLRKIGDEQPMGQTVTISGGNPNAYINMRYGPSREYKIRADIPQGSTGELIGYSDDGNWAKVSVNGKTGYVQTQFVHTETAPITNEPITTPTTDGETVTVFRSELEKAYDIIGDLLGLRG